MTDRPYSPTLIDRLAGAERVAVLTGAGISAESGVPTFREPGGLWDQFRPEELANVDAFMRNPKRVQGWYAHRREVVEATLPNPGHHALAALEALLPHFLLCTQNVDGLHQRAGSANVLELHGSLTRSYCMQCRRPAREEDLAVEAGVFACPDCGGLLRPDVVWFGERLPPGAMETASTAAQNADVFLSIGTSAVVYPAAGLPLMAREAGAYVAEVNIAESEIGGYLNEVVLGKAGVVLPALVAAVKRQRAAPA